VYPTVAVSVDTNPMASLDTDPDESVNENAIAPFVIVVATISVISILEPAGTSVEPVMETDIVTEDSLESEDELEISFATSSFPEKV